MCEPQTSVHLLTMLTVLLVSSSPPCCCMLCTNLFKVCKAEQWDWLPHSEQLTSTLQSRFKCAFEPQHRKQTPFSFSSWRLSSIDFARNALHLLKACFEFVYRIQFLIPVSGLTWFLVTSVFLTCSEYLLSSVPPGCCSHHTWSLGLSLFYSFLE